jgi:hypothetical protein
MTMQQSTIDLDQLSAFFGPEDIEWKPIATSKRTGKALAAAYVTNRAIMDRLDAVCGPANWRNAYKPGPAGGIICGLSIRVPREDGSAEWVTKWDGADNTDIHPVKGGLSSAMRRAAVQWGVGRYLYRLPSQWVPVDERGRFKKAPQIPHAFLPDTNGVAASNSDAGSASGASRQRGTNGTRRLSDEAAGYMMPRG